MNLFTHGSPFITRLQRVMTKVFCSLTVILLLHVAAFSQSANILITPASSTINIGQSFTVNVRVDMQSGSCNAAEVHLNFDPAFLRITNITRPSSGTFTSETIPLPASPYSTANSAGHLEYAAGIPSGSTSADFDILAITFSTPVSSPQTGTTSLSLQNTPGHRTRTALNGTPLTGTLTGASATIQGCTSPTASIAAAASSTICNGQPIGLRLASATGTSPYSIVVNGTTYPGATVGSTFATIPFPTYKIWPSASPTGAGEVRQNDGGAIEVGTKFTSTQTGFVKGVRFYSGSGSYTVSGTYKGKLWNFNTGALLGTVNFTGVTKGAWQEVMFATPVSIAANTTYLITSYSSAGNYVATDGYFSTGVTNGPLTALANSTSVNGMYFFGSEQAGPTTNFSNWQFFQSANYWVDVIFVPNTASFALTSVTDANGCNSTGSPLQTLNILSVDCSSLPVTLLNLSASPAASKVTVRWTTSSEINNLGFEVQRSTDGNSWTTLGFVQGAGNSSTTRSYSYLDNNLEPRKYYYKLKQIDIDQHYKYSSIVTATLNGKADFVLEQNFPNPFTTQTTIQFTMPKRETVTISLFDMNGRVLKTLINGTKEAGSHVITLNTGTLPKGIYYYRMQAGDFTDAKKLTIQ